MDLYLSISAGLGLVSADLPGFELLLYCASSIVHALVANPQRLQSRVVRIQSVPLLLHLLQLRLGCLQVLLHALQACLHGATSKSRAQLGAVLPCKA